MNTNNKILVVVDCQQDFFTGVLGNKYTKAIVPNVTKIVNEFVNNNFPIIFTLDTHTENGYFNCREGKHLPVSHCLIGTEGYNLIPELEVTLNYTKADVINKLDSFGFNYLIDKLKYSKFKFLDPFKEYEIHICGVVTNMCVLSVALNFQNLFTKSEIIIHSDACASNDPEMHQKALDIMRGLQMQVI